MVHFDSGPGGRAGVASIAIHACTPLQLTDRNMVTRLHRQPISWNAVAVCTPRRHRHVGMELGRCPVGEALVAGAARRRGGDVCGCLACG